MNQGYIAHPAPPVLEPRSYAPEGFPPGLPWWYYGPLAAPVPAQRPPEAPGMAGSVRKLAYSVEEAAEALGVSRSLVYQLIHQSGFPSVKLRGRRLISAELLAEWMRAQAGGGIL